MRQRSALLQLQMALSLVLALTLVLALVRNIIIFSKVRILVLNQPINFSPLGSQRASPCQVDMRTTVKNYKKTVFFVFGTCATLVTLAEAGNNLQNGRRRDF